MFQIHFKLHLPLRDIGQRHYEKQFEPSCLNLEGLSQSQDLSHQFLSKNACGQYASNVSYRIGLAAPRNQDLLDMFRPE